MHTYRYKPTQSNKIINGCQGLKEILTDINSCDQNCSHAKWLNRERESGIPSVVPPCGKGICHKVAAPYFIIIIIMYIVQLFKEDWGILHMLGCRA